MSVALPSSAPHLIAALVTPFIRPGEIDRASIARLVAYLQRGGIDEYFVVGSTGEAALLDEADRLGVIESVRAAAPGRLVYAGISGTGPRQAVRNAREAAKAGADVAVLMSPYFLALDQEQLVAFCLGVADQSPIPLAVYHHIRMPTPFAVPTVARLSQHANIVAIKDTNGGDHDRCAEILAVTDGRPFCFFQGVEKLVLSTLQSGGHGCVVAQGSIAPHLFRALFAAWRARDFPAAEQLQRQITDLWSIFSRPEVKQSFCHFLHTLKLPLQQRGVISTTAGALSGVRFEPEFERMISAFMQQHLEPARSLRTA